MWAILSGIEGNLTAYEAVLADIKQQTAMEALYVLGDVVGPGSDNDATIDRLRSPKPGELEPQVCTGWWEEQCFALHAVGTTSDPVELRDRYGSDAIVQLWNSVSRDRVQWLRSLNFGFVELDCLLIHGSSVSASEELTPNTPPWLMLDRLQRMGVNSLFCGRSGLAFEYRLETSTMNTTVTTLDGQRSPETIQSQPRQAIGVGNVGRKPGEASYVLYSPGSDRNAIQFKTVLY
ncbi:MAG: metallophosphatase [Cyanobacteria bacterium SBLK]|nr:metallophosphatase [Cyanobacteria bacterium SBLK]